MTSYFLMLGTKERNWEFLEWEREVKAVAEKG